MKTTNFGRAGFAFVLAGAFAISAFGCAADFGADENVATGEQAVVSVPAKGAATTLDVASWNLEWFGDTANGPTNETLQLENARDVISGTDFDVWGVAEIVSATQFNSLKSQLGYSGFLANDAVVTNGSAYYSSTEQKVGFLYKSSVATLVSAKVILTANDFDFAGRPPLEARLNVTLNGTTEQVVFIVLHMKAFDDADSWARRQNASDALKSYLDTTYPTQKVFVVGDWNDDLDTSITPQKPSPYANFVSDSADYAFPTKALTDAGIASTVGYPDMIDHHLNTNDLNAQYIPNSVEVYRVDSYVPSYDTTTSDHFPVLSRYTWAGGATPAVTVTAPNGGEGLTGGAVQNITWTSANVSNVNIDYSLNGGTSWSSIVTGLSASPASYAWAVPSTATSNGLIRITDASGPTSDQSNGFFSINLGGGPAQLILNEICANEPGSSVAGEFIEVVNIGGTAANIGGYTLSDATSVRHTFAAGTTLNPGKAIVVFGASSGIPGGLINAVASSTGTLSLNNSSDTASLKNGATVIDSFSYGSALSGTDGVSMNRNPDGSTGGFVLHTALSSSQRSPGVRASGAAW